MRDVFILFRQSPILSGRISYLIRPLIYVEEREIKGFVKSYGLKTVPSPCMVNGVTKRQYIKELLLQMSKDNREIKSNIFGAVKRSGIDAW